MQKSCFLFSLLVAIILPFTGNTQEPVVKHYSIEGHPSEIGAETLVQDEQGYLWIGSESGVYRYDGEHFTLIKGSAGKRVSALYPADSGIWVGFADGTLACIGNQFKNELTLSRFQQNGPILSLYPTASEDSLWIGGEGGIHLLYKDSLLLSLDVTNGLSDDYIYSIQPLGNQLLLGTDRGLNRLHFSDNAVQVEVHTTVEGLPDNIIRVIEPSGRKDWFWVGMQQNGLALYNAGNRQVHRFPELNDWKYGQVNDVLSLSGKRSWAVTDNYLIELKLDDQLALQLNIHYYPDRVFKKLICDYAGNLWAATEEGINMISALYLNKIILPEPYDLNKVKALAGSIGDTLWLAQERLLYRVVHTPDKEIRMQAVFESRTPISSLYLDYSGRLWLGTLGDGLWWRDKTGKFHAAGGSELLEQSHILSITGSPEKLWIAVLPGLLELSLPSDSRDPPFLIRHLGKSAGTGSDYIYYLLSGKKEDVIWMATDGAGLRKMRYSGDFAAGRLPSILNDKVVYSVAEAANPTGQVFLVFERCVNIWYPASRQFRHFNQALEIGIDSMATILNCMAQDSFGNVYVPYGQGLLMFPAGRRTFDIRPNIFITRVSTALGPGEPLTGRFKYDQNYLNFTYEGINFTNPERLQYRYMLEGLGEHWIYTRDESVTFPNLPPGDYTFRVQSSLDNDFSRAKEDSYAFKISPPFWKRPIFLITLIALFCFLFYRIIKVRDSNQKALSQLKQERMRFEYEHLKSQVNPHFLFNSLNTLGNMIEENSEAALSYTESLSDLYKNILKYRNRDLILLEEEIRILKGYLRVQQSRFGTALQYELDIPENLMTSKKIIPMGLQMLVENAIKHNIVSQTQPLKIKILSEDEYIVVSNPVQLKINPKTEAGVGLLNIQKRYALLTKRNVFIGRNSGQFIVKLPLL